MRIITLTVALLFVLTACESTPEDVAPPEETEEVAQAEESEAEQVDDSHGHEGEEELAEDLEPGENRHFGAPFAIEDDPVDLAALLATVADKEEFESDEPVKVSAQIHQVCQKKGCWFTLATEEVEVPVRVRMKDYGFFVSRNTEGADAIVEGTLARTTISEEMAQHYAEDVAEHTGEEPEQVEGEQDTFEFTATAISLTLSEG